MAVDQELGYKHYQNSNWPGRPTIWIRVGQGPTALAVGAGGGCLDVFSLVCHLPSSSLSLGDGPIQTEILSQRADKPKTTMQPTKAVTATIVDGC